MIKLGQTRSTRSKRTKLTSLIKSEKNKLTLSPLLDTLSLFHFPFSLSSFSNLKGSSSMLYCSRSLASPSTTHRVLSLHRQNSNNNRFLFFFFLSVHLFMEVWKIMVKPCKHTITLSSCMLSLALACKLESENPKDNTDYRLKPQIRRIFQLFV